MLQWYVLQQFRILLQECQVTLFGLCGTSVYHPVFHVQKLAFKDDSSDVGEQDGRREKSLQLAFRNTVDTAVAHSFDGNQRRKSGHIPPGGKDTVTLKGEPERNVHSVAQIMSSPDTVGYQIEVSIR